MAKTASYHRAAVLYNQELADFAEALAERLEDPDVTKWCRSVAKQHQFHLGRHQRALAKVEGKTEEDPAFEKALAETQTEFAEAFEKLDQLELREIALVDQSVCGGEIISVTPIEEVSGEPVETPAEELVIEAGAEEKYETEAPKLTREEIFARAAALNNTESTEATE